MTTKCKVHRQYQVKRKPRADCLDCWKMYAEKAEARLEEAARLLSDIAASKREGVSLTLYGKIDAFLESGK